MNNFLRALLIVPLFYWNCSNKPKPVTEKDDTGLRKTLEAIMSRYKADIGVAFMHLENGDTMTIHNERHYPMQSTYKFPLAMAVLHEVDKKRMSLDQKVHISKEDLRPGTWSPLRENYPQGDIDVTVAELIEYTVGKSDNNTCDILFGMMGGPSKVNSYIHSLGVKDIEIATTEDSMHQSWDVQFTNWCEPFAMTRLLEGLHKKKFLSDSSTSFLLGVMTGSMNSPYRIMGLLPRSVTVAHKTGTSDTMKGIRAAVNDAGIITLPDGKHIALTVFVSNSPEEFPALERVMAEIARAVYDHYALSDSMQKDIEALVHEKNDENFNGVILVTRDGKTIYSKAVGYSDMEARTPLKTDDQFVIGSVSKQFTAVMVMREVEKGHIHLNDHIGKYLPDLKQPWKDSVTVDQLLTHMHGIVALDKPLSYKPGTKMDYPTGNGPGYHLLSLILEKTSGKSFVDLSSELFAECGMTHTFHPGKKQYNALVKGYSRDMNGKWNFQTSDIDIYPAARSFISTSGDLLLWNQHLHNGKLLRPETYNLLSSAKPGVIRQHGVFGHTEYGYGMTVDTRDGILQLGQTGYVPGFASMNFYFPESKTSMIVLSNAVHTPDDLRNGFYYHVQMLQLARAFELKYKDRPDGQESVQKS